MSEDWKAFETDSEAGRLLNKLYGGSRKVKINYPGKIVTRPPDRLWLIPSVVLKTKKSRPLSGQFIPGGSTLQSKDPRSKSQSSRNSERAINVPQPVKVGLPPVPSVG
jgi:hypothetical protein